MLLRKELDGNAQVFWKYEGELLRFCLGFAVQIDGVHFRTYNAYILKIGVFGRTI